MVFVFQCGDGFFYLCWCIRRDTVHCFVSVPSCCRRFCVGYIELTWLRGLILASVSVIAAKVGFCVAVILSWVWRQSSSTVYLKEAQWLGALPGLEHWFSVRYFYMPYAVFYDAGH